MYPNNNGRLVNEYNGSPPTELPSNESHSALDIDNNAFDEEIEQG